MRADELTDREWWLVRQTYETTLVSLLHCCERTGLPGKIIIERLVEEAAESNISKLRAATEALLGKYKPDAD